MYKNNKKEVLRNFSLEIKKGEFVVIVGPSGSGKSTLLEIICGFEAPSSGKVFIDNEIINDILPKDRNVSMVFQNYALYPHLNVYENIAFGMRMRKNSKKEIESKVNWAAKTLELEEYLDKKPKNLSGGQRQRVALARAMVREPKLFLMDEPLSNLDAKLKYATSLEIKKLHNALGATTIYVTHDQIEALTMADKLVVLDNGEIKQEGTPKEVYENPSDIFVAKFLGKPEINLFNIKIDNNKVVFENSTEIDKNIINYNLKDGKEYILGVRPEDIEFDENGTEVIVSEIQYLGSEILLELSYKNIMFNMKSYRKENLNKGDRIKVKFNFNNINIFDKETNKNIKRRNINEKKNN